MIGAGVVVDVQHLARVPRLQPVVAAAPPDSMNSKRWLAPSWRVHCDSAAPSAVLAPDTSSALPLPRLTSTYQASVSTVAACAVPAAPIPLSSAATKAITGRALPYASRLPTSTR
jgi:hypothetical protein